MDGKVVNFILYHMQKYSSDVSQNSTKRHQTELVKNNKLAMIVHRRGDKSLSKFYKDLMITKRQLTDLRESIAKTLSDLNQPLPRHPTVIRNKKKICFSCGANYQPAVPHRCRAAVRKGMGSKQFLRSREGERGNGERNRKLDGEQQNECQLCFERYLENQEVHEAEFCGHVRLNCQHCGSKIKRKDLSEHVLCCCFYICPKCQKSIYYKVYSYHSGKCSAEAEKLLEKTINMTKTRRISKENTRSPYSGKRYYPCSILQ